MTLSDPNPGIKVTVYGIQTLDPDFKVTTFFDIEYLRNDTRQNVNRKSYALHRMVILIMTLTDPNVVF